MASAKRAKNKINRKSKGSIAKKSAVRARAEKAPQAAAGLAKKAKKAIEKGVKKAAAKKVAADAKKGVAGARKGVEKKAAAIAKRATKQARSVAKQAGAAKATVIEKAELATKAARKKAKSLQEKAEPSEPSAVDPGTNGTIAVGSPAPAFSLPDQTGKLVTSASLKGAPYVLYFYPKDDTPGCTKEACAFRDSGPAFGKNGVRVIGVSPDPQKSHSRFSEKYALPFTLLSDEEKTLAAAYGVWVEKQNYGRKYMGIERSTFLVDAGGRVQKIWRGVRVPGHVEDVLLASGTI